MAFLIDWSLYLSKCLIQCNNLCYDHFSVSISVFNSNCFQLPWINTPKGENVTTSYKKLLFAVHCDLSTFTTINCILLEIILYTVPHLISLLIHIFFQFFFYLGFTAQVLKVCRTPGPTAY